MNVGTVEHLDDRFRRCARRLDQGLYLLATGVGGATAQRRSGWPMLLEHARSDPKTSIPVDVLIGAPSVDTTIDRYNHLGGLSG